MMKRLFVLMASLVLLPIYCTAAGLTRPQAKAVIEHSDNYKLQKQPIHISRSQADACVKKGYLTWEMGVVGPRLLLTTKGRFLFENVTGTLTPAGTEYTPLTVTLNTPLKPSVTSVTGITDGENASKIVEYQWQWDASDQTPEVRDLIFNKNPINDGKATLKLYDDGWRCVKFE